MDVNGALFDLMRANFQRLAILAVAFWNLFQIGSAFADLTFTFTSDSEVAVTSGNYSASGMLNISLAFAPAPGTQLNVIKNTGTAFLNGTFSNVPQGGTVQLNYGGVVYDFVANYYGGNGRSLVLQWARVGIGAFGDNLYGQLGNKLMIINPFPVAVDATGVLAGKSVVAIKAGNSNSFALTSDGRVFAWGSNSYGGLGNNSVNSHGVPVEVDTSGILAGKTIVVIADGNTSSNHKMVLTSDGQIFGWGQNRYGELGNTASFSRVPVVVSTNGVLAGKTVVAIATGKYYSVALTGDGHVFTWGLNTSGELGNNSTISSRVPVAVSANGVLAGKMVVAITAGSSHSLALTADGQVFGWGLNTSGQLGNNSTTNSLVPVEVNANGVLAGKTVVAIAAGSSHSLALTADGQVFGWGLNTSGQLGNNSTIRSRVPVAVNTSGALAGKMVVGIAAGDSHSMAVTSDGQVFTWGSNQSGQLGNNSLINASVPVSVDKQGILEGKKVVGIAAGYSHSMVVTSDGQVFAWGSNDKGELGDNTLTKNTLPSVVDASGGLASKTVVAVRSGGSHSMALTSDGQIFGWGLNTSGQLGNNSTTNSPVPVEVNANGVLASKMVVAIAAGNFHNMALTAGGQVFGWGLNTSGQLGNNSTATSRVPVAVSTNGALAGKTVVAIAAGNSHNMALTAGGQVFGWGLNTSGQLGNNSTISSRVPLAVSTNGALAGKTVVAIAAGDSHNMALTADGQIFGWGLNTSGQLGNNSTTNSPVPVEVSPNGALAGKTVVAIAAGSSHSLALTADSQVFAWGTNWSGLLGNNSTVSSPVPVAVDTSGALAGKKVVAIAAGSSLSMALTSDGQVFAWGSGIPRNNRTISSRVPIAVDTSGVLSQKRVVAIDGDSHNLALFGLPVLPVIENSPASQKCFQGANVSFSASVEIDPLIHSVQWQVSTTGATGTFSDITNNPTATTGNLTLTDVNSTMDGFAYRAVFSNSAGSVTTLPATLTVLAERNLYATFNFAEDVPLQAEESMTISGFLDVNLGFAPAPGTQLTVIKNTGTGFLNGTFSNVPQGGIVQLTYGGATYNFVANYYGGNGRSLVLQWAHVGIGAFGGNSYGQLGNNSTTNCHVPVAVDTSGVLAGKKVVAVAAGWSHSLALTSDGQVFAWGSNSYGQLGNNSTTTSHVPVAVDTTGALAGKTVVAIATNWYSSIALTSDGQIFCWGPSSEFTSYGFSYSESLVPVPLNTGGLLDGKRVVAIAGGDLHYLAVTSDGEIFGWGNAPDGGLGPNLGGFISLGGKKAVAVAAGYDASWALTSDGQIFAWGTNFDGKLGDDSDDLTFDPVAVYASGVLVGKIVQAIEPSMALTSDGQVFTWGSNANGELGNNSTTISLAPVAVDTSGALAGKTITAIAGGGSSRIALSSDGQVFTWGDNFFGQLGTNSTVRSLVPVPVDTSGVLAGKRVTAISSRYTHCLAVTADGQVFAWGTNAIGELGIGVQRNNLLPVAVDTSRELAGKTIVAIAAGIHYSMALTSEGRVFAWGYNLDGQLGNNSTISSRVPVAVDTSGALAGKTVVVIAAGNIWNGHSMALTSEGQVFSWGSNNGGQLGNNSEINSKVPVAVDTSGVLAGRRVVAIAAGYSHSLALTSEGRVFSWGSNNNGQLGNDSTTSSKVPIAVHTSGALAGKRVVAIAAGYSHSLALTSEGQVFAWGSNWVGKLGNNSTISSQVPVAVDTSGVLAGRRVVSIAAGNSYGMALTEDGQIFSWGSNWDGALGNNSTVSSQVPVAVDTSGVLAGKRVIGIAAGAYHSLALTSDGQVAVWGGAYSSDVWFDSVDSLVPVALDTSGILAGKMVVGIAGGYRHSLISFSAGLPSVVTNPSNQTSAFGDSVSFTASAANDNPISSVQWQVSTTGLAGPFTNITDNPTALTNTLTLNGVDLNRNGYAYRAVFTNLAGSQTTTPATLVVQRTFASFLDQYDLRDPDPAADPYKIGISQLLAYALGANPFSPNRSQLPSMAIQNGHLTITYPRWKDAADVSYVVEVSSDLENWYSGANHTQDVSVTPIDFTREWVVNRDLMPMDSASRRFIRLKVINLDPVDE